MIAYRKQTLANGLTVVVNRDRTSKLAAVNLLYKVGARNENPSRTGFAHLFEHLMFRGTKAVPDFDTPVQMACGENNAFTNNDYTDFYITLPKDNIETALWLESDRMTGLVDELLDISKIDMGRQQLTLSEMDVRELLYDSIRAVEPAAAGGIAIVPDFPEEPVMVSCDDTRLRRAVTNILSNGVRYARSELRLTCRADKRQVTIRIQDDGDGIAEEDLPHIFDRFYMGKSGKSGIGLALTREIIHLHKGTIRARNGDTGAVFEISIPVSR